MFSRLLRLFRRSEPIASVKFCVELTERTGNLERIDRFFKFWGPEERADRDTWEARWEVFQLSERITGLDVCVSLSDSDEPAAPRTLVSW